MARAVGRGTVLSKAFVDERFAFTGTVLRGIPENRAALEARH